MFPMLLNRVDTVVIEPITKPFKKYDVVLFRRGKQLVLHRIIKVESEFCLIRGDNCIAAEKVYNEQIIGMLTRFCHKGKDYSVTHKGYRFYSKLWVSLHVVIAFYHIAKRFLYRIFTRINKKHRY
jgi:hypothetical protein